MTSAMAFRLAWRTKRTLLRCCALIRSIVNSTEASIGTLLHNIKTVNAAVLTKPVMLKSGAELMYSFVHVKPITIVRVTTTVAVHLRILIPSIEVSVICRLDLLWRYEAPNRIGCEPFGERADPQAISKLIIYLLEIKRDMNMFQIVNH